MEPLGPDTARSEKEGPSEARSAMARNVRLYPWFRFVQNLIFWQAVWFLYFQNELSAAQAILLYAIFDLSTTVLEVPSGYMSDKFGRRVTLLASTFAGALSACLIALASGFVTYAVANVLLGAWAAFASGTDSALLYESLAADEREDEIGDQELKAWRFTFVALAISAVLGGLMTQVLPELPYVAVALAMIASFAIACLFREPPKAGSAPTSERARLGQLRAAFVHPVLIWLFGLSVAMYVFSHIPFVFGQPFIQQALESSGFAGETPLISGMVTAIMMLFSVLTSWVAPKLRNRLGLGRMLLLAFFMQIALAGLLAITNATIAIAFLFLRMVPDSLSRPFIVARIQPLLGNDSRATYLSMQSLCGRLMFVATLSIASLNASSVGTMAYGEIQPILWAYVLLGALVIVVLWAASRHVAIEGP